MLVYEDGPADLFANLRRAAGVANMEDGSRIPVYGLPKWQYFFASIFSCIYCMSVWVGFLFSVPFSDTVVNWFIYSMFCSTAAIFITLVHEKLTNG